MTKLLTMMMYSQMDEPARIMYTFHVGDSRNVYVDEDDDVKIADNESGKCAFFVARRSVRFVQEIPNIDRAVRRAMMYKPTNFQLHIGGRIDQGLRRSWWSTSSDSKRDAADGRHHRPHFARSIWLPSTIYTVGVVPQKLPGETVFIPPPTPRYLPPTHRPCPRSAKLPSTPCRCLDGGHHPDRHASLPDCHRHLDGDRCPSRSIPYRPGETVTIPPPTPRYWPPPRPSPPVDTTACARPPVHRPRPR